MQRNSEMNAILSVGFTSIQSLPAKNVILRYNCFAHTQRRFLAGVTDPFLRQDMTMCVCFLREREEGADDQKQTVPYFHDDEMRTFLHSCAQRLGLQRLSSTIAIRVILSAIDGWVKEPAR